MPNMSSKDATSSSTKSTKKSPVALAEEAIQAGVVEGDDEVPEVKFPGGLNPSDITSEATKAILNQAIDTIKLNQVQQATAMSERNMIEEQQKLAAAKAPSQRPAAQGAGRVGGLFGPIPLDDRAAILDAALKNLESDEAKAKFMADHPELLSPSPGPFQSKAIPTVSHQPVDPIGSTVNALEGFSRILIGNLQAGMDIQRAVTPQQQPAPQAQAAGAGAILDVVKVVETFKEINAANSKTFSDIMTSVNSNFKTIIDGMQKEKADIQREAAEAKNQLIEKEQEYLRKELEQMREAANRGPSLDLEGIAALINRSKESNMPIDFVTPDQRRTEADIARQDKVLDDDLEEKRHRRKMEELKEQRRLSMLTAAGGTFQSIIGGSHESHLMRKHQPSSVASSVGDRF